MKKWYVLLVQVLFFLKPFAQNVAKPPTAVLPAFKKDTFNIMRFNAVPDGKTLNTGYINAAIDACNKNGGGVVLVPAGLWLTGPIILKSNVNLHLNASATLLFTSDFNEYKLLKGDWEGLPQMRNQSPISANNQTNIAITGDGIIDGNGDAWRAVKKDYVSPLQWKKLVASGGVLSEDGTSWYPSEKSMKGAQMKNPGVISSDKDSSFFEGIKDFLRPNLLVLMNCKRILLQGITFQNSPAWCLHPLLCEDVTVKNISVKNPSYAQNGDGIDVESCKNVVIENSVFDVGDDALCMKSGRDAEGRKRNIPTENINIEGCTIYAAHGGFVIGSEMSGGVKNIYVSNCTFIGTDIGLRFKTTRGRGGVVENIFIQNIYMKNIVAAAILFDMYYMINDSTPQLKPVDETTPQFKNFVIQNVYCNGAAQAVFIRGLPEMHIQNIALQNMVLQSTKGIDVEEATGINFKDVQVFSKETNPVISIMQSDHVDFENFAYSPDAELLLKINGERSNNIEIKKTDTSKAKEKIEFENNADRGSVTFIP